LRLSIKVKHAKPEVTDRFQDGRRRHVGNSSACYNMGNYHHFRKNLVVIAHFTACI
jgi:hypothetical protein